MIRADVVTLYEIASSLTSEQAATLYTYMGHATGKEFAIGANGSSVYVRIDAGDEILQDELSKLKVIARQWLYKKLLEEESVEAK